MADIQVDVNRVMEHMRSMYAEQIASLTQQVAMQTAINEALTEKLEALDEPEP